MSLISVQIFRILLCAATTFKSDSIQLRGKREKCVFFFSFLFSFSFSFFFFSFSFSFFFFTALVVDRKLAGGSRRLRPHRLSQTLMVFPKSCSARCFKCLPGRPRGLYLCVCGCDGGWLEVLHVVTNLGEDEVNDNNIFSVNMFWCLCSSVTVN